MDIKAFAKSPSGRLIQTVRDYHAYIPNPLPASLEGLGIRLDTSLLRLVGEAHSALGRLSGIGLIVPNPDFLVIPYIKLEAVASSRIEGTQASLSELFYFEAASQEVPRNPDLLEVANYVAALKSGLERLKKLPLSLRLVRELHISLMAGVRGGGSDRTSGEFRRSQNWIGAPGCQLKDATYVPPPNEEMTQALGEWEQFLHVRHEMPTLIQAALIHYQFEAIHPFLDGNGRIGRLLITLFLCERGELPQPLLYLSAYFERYRGEYYERLLAVSRDGDWNGWLRFFLQGVTAQSEHAYESAKRIIERLTAYREILQSHNAPSSVLRLLEMVFTSPYVTARQVSAQLDITFPTAQKAIDALSETGILSEITGYQRNRIYVARELLQVLAENEPIYEPKHNDQQR